MIQANNELTNNRIETNKHTETKGIANKGISLEQKSDNVGWIPLQLTRILSHLPVRFFYWFYWLKNNETFPTGKCDSYTRMLQMNPPFMLFKD